MARVKIHSTTTDQPHAPRGVDCNVEAATTPPRFYARCDEFVSAAIQMEPNEASGTVSAVVFTVIVSNDPAGRIFNDHPSTITLAAGSRITQVFSVAGYAWVGVRLSTVNGSALQAHIHIVLKDSPA